MVRCRHSVDIARKKESKPALIVYMLYRECARGGAKKALRPARRRELIDELRLVWQVSVRGACAVLGAVRSTYQYQSRRPPQAVLQKRILEIAQTRVRYRYRRIHVLLKREGWQVNVKRVYRLYAEESLQLRNKTPKRKVSAKLREERSVASEPNEVWAMDFTSDQFFDGRRIRILTIIDAFSRLSPAIDVRQSYRGSDVVETLERVTPLHGKPRTIRVDNGPEFICKALDLWSYLNGVTLDFSRPGKPTDNAFIESFNGSFRAESLNASWFLSLEDARSRCEAWRIDYIEVRPHSSIGQKTPIELAKGPGQAGVCPATIKLASAVPH